MILKLPVNGYAHFTATEIVNNIAETIQCFRRAGMLRNCRQIRQPDVDAAVGVYAEKHRRIISCEHQRDAL
jgi:hypothetical protein